MIKLPERYCNTMKELLGDEEYGAYLDSFQQTQVHGLRVNTGKLTPETFRKLTELPLTPVPWVDNGFYYEDASAPARHPHYYAGLYYLQEPSAMTPASRLPVVPGDRVLDLCAAPGGKATELGARLCGRGFLLANDLSVSRARALLKNLELAGISNVFVTGERPERLAEVYPEYFDKILIDAPCSGEGMFRRDSRMISQWESRQPQAYTEIQRSLTEYGCRMLRPGGMMLYSTCTFSKEENEECILQLLEQHPELETVPIRPYEGFTAGFCGLSDAVRIFPHKMRGEGHFLVLLRKKGTPVSQTGRKIPEEKLIKLHQLPEPIRKFLEHVTKDFSAGGFLLERDQLYYLEESMERKKGLRYLRSGLLAGTWNKNRFEPSQAFAMALKKAEFQEVLDFPSSDPCTVKYLKGETLNAQNNGDPGFPWRLICTDGYPLGWAKISGNVLKNKYCPGWRWQ